MPTLAEVLPLLVRLAGLTAQIAADGSRYSLGVAAVVAPKLNQLTDELEKLMLRANAAKP